MIKGENAPEMHNTCMSGIEGAHFAGSNMEIRGCETSINRNMTGKMINDTVRIYFPNTRIIRSRSSLIEERTGKATLLKILEINADGIS